MGVHKRWALLCWLTLNLVLPVFCLAAVSGQCSNCHTMHNLQDGSPVAYTMDPDGEINLREQPFGNLLKTDCLGCHTSAGAETIVDLGGSDVPIVFNLLAPTYPPDGSAASTLAGGNFHWMLAGGDAYGHNVAGITGDDGASHHGILDLLIRDQRARRDVAVLDVVVRDRVAGGHEDLARRQGCAEAVELAGPGRRFEPRLHPCRTQELVGLGPLLLPFHLAPAEGLELEEITDEMKGMAGDENRTRFREFLHPRGKVRGVPQGGVVHPQIVPDAAHDHRPRVEAHTHREIQPEGFPDLLPDVHPVHAVPLHAAHHQDLLVQVYVLHVESDGRAEPDSGGEHDLDEHLIPPGLGSFRLGQRRQ